MCGIVGICGSKSTPDRLIEGLRHLEYRGYDSAGIAVLNQNKQIECRRAVGKLINLSQHLQESKIDGHTGIGHTRWATHGAPTIENTHPHVTDNLAIVHNGIIENYQKIKQDLIDKGIEFSSDTDTEVVARLLDYNLQKGLTPLQATVTTVASLEGAYALAIIFKNHDNLIIGARHGAPLALGYGDGEHYLGSDRLALAHLTKQISYLEDGDIAVLTAQNVHIYDKNNQEVTRPIHLTDADMVNVSKGTFPHYMLKEIYEQPESIQQTLSHYLNHSHNQITIPDFPIDVTKIPRITIIACGTAYYAGVVAKYWLESIARIPVEVDIASEFRYRQGPLSENGMAIFISQSGETADTLAAHSYAKSCGQYTIGIINVPESSLSREVDRVLYTYAGPEIGVASTKAFTTQLTVLAALTLKLASQRLSLNDAEISTYCKTLTHVPAYIQKMLSLDKEIKELAKKIKGASDVLYIGRGTSYPIALEGALKLKEISYIHAEAYAAGEMKHGPIALIDENVPVVIIAPQDQLFDKTISNLQEVLSRHGQVILFSDADNIKIQDITHIKMPTVDPFITPILYALPMQLLAYHTAILKGTDVDQPRNLAKSVTVE